MVCETQVARRVSRTARLWHDAMANPLTVLHLDDARLVDPCWIISGGRSLAQLGFCRPRVAPSWGRHRRSAGGTDRLSWGWEVTSPDVSTGPAPRERYRLTASDSEDVHEPRSEEPSGSEGRGKTGAEGPAPAAPPDGDVMAPKKNEDPNGEHEPIWTDSQDDIPAEPKPDEGGQD